MVESSFGMIFQVLSDDMKVLGHYRPFGLTPFWACPFKILTYELRIHDPGNVERKHRCVHSFQSLEPLISIVEPGSGEIFQSGLRKGQ